MLRDAALAMSYNHLAADCGDSEVSAVLKRWRKKKESTAAAHHTRGHLLPLTLIRMVWFEDP